MKKSLLYLISFLSIFVYSCGNDDKGQEIIKPIVAAIDISDKSLTLKVGDKHQYIANYSPKEADSPKYKWSVSDPTVASIDTSGLLTAIKDGNTDVVLSANTQSGSLKSTSKVIVSPIEIESISLDTDNIKLSWGEKKTLNVTISPSNAKTKKIAWTSSDESIATVNNGEVVAIKTGNAIIIAKIEGSEIKAECKVEVVKTAVKSIKFDYPDATIEEGGTLQTNIVILPLNADNKNVTYSSTNESVATINSDGLITAKKKGLVRIYAKSEDSGLEDYISLTVVDFSSNIYAFHMGNSTSINGVVVSNWTVKLRNNSLKTVKISGMKIIDGTGKIIKEESLNATLASKTNYETNVSLNRVYNPLIIFYYTESGKSYELIYDPQKK